VFSGELKKLIFQVLTSWQVLVVTLGIILYIFIVSYVSQLYRRVRPKVFKDKKPKKEKKSAEVIEETGELGLGD
jgi:hypothetical protein